MDIEFNGIPLNPQQHIVWASGTASLKPLPGRTINETAALRYVWRRISQGKEYISLRRMSRQLGCTEEMCENYIAKFHVERVIPRTPIIEELEG
jgi:hypothetical protein